MLEEILKGYKLKTCICYRIFDAKRRIQIACNIAEDKFCWATYIFSLCPCHYSPLTSYSPESMQAGLLRNISLSEGTGEE